jgi:hypothetical protein
MKPTRVPVLLLALLLTGAIGYLLAETSYSGIPPLPGPAPISLVLLAVVEAAMAYVVRSKVRGRRPAGRTPGRAMHPMQVARAAVLAKASSLGGALVAGCYGGLFLWTFPRRGDVATYSHDARVAGLSALAALALVVTALLLERACRTPDSRPDAPVGQESR